MKDSMAYWLKSEALRSGWVAFKQKLCSSLVSCVTWHKLLHLPEICIAG